MKNNLKVLRKEKGLTLKNLSKSSGFGISTIGNFENGKTDASEDFLKKIAFVLGVTIEKLVGGDSHKEIETVPVAAMTGWNELREEPSAYGDTRKNQLGLMIEGLESIFKIWRKDGAASYEDFGMILEQLMKDKVSPEFREATLHALYAEMKRQREKSIAALDSNTEMENKEIGAENFIAVPLATEKGIHGVFKIDSRMRPKEVLKKNRPNPTEEKR